MSDPGPLASYSVLRGVSETGSGERPTEPGTISFLINDNYFCRSTYLRTGLK